MKLNWWSRVNVQAHRIVSRDTKRPWAVRWRLAWRTSFECLFPVHRCLVSDTELRDAYVRLVEPTIGARVALDSYGYQAMATRMATTGLDREKCMSCQNRSRGRGAVGCKRMRTPDSNQLSLFPNTQNGCLHGECLNFRPLATRRGKDEPAKTI